MHLWRYIGWLMGVEEENNPCVDVPHGKAALESIVMHLLEPDRDSIAVAHHLLQAPSRGARSLRFRHELCRRFLGRDLADALELKRDTTMEGLGQTRSHRPWLVVSFSTCPPIPPPPPSPLFCLQPYKK